MYQQKNNQAFAPQLLLKVQGYSLLESSFSLQEHPTASCYLSREETDPKHVAGACLFLTP